MTGKLNNPVFGQPTHRIISVLLHDIKTEGLVPGEGKLGIKKKEQSLKKNGVTGGTVSLFFTPVSFFCCALCPSSPNSCISTSDRQQAAMPVQVQGGNGVKQHRGCYQKKTCNVATPPGIFSVGPLCFLRRFGRPAPLCAGFVSAFLS